MPTTSSPVKRPGLGRRAISSHAVVTRTTPSQAHTTSTGDLSSSHSNSSHHLHHKPHHTHHRPRPHLVGGGHRHHPLHHHHNHSRNPSFGKNANKLQRLTSAVTAATDSGRHHQRKKSAPATPAASPPRGGNHVRWDGALEDPHPKVSSMKKNNSSPALRRHNSSGAVVTRKSLAAANDRPRSSSGKKKTVGFELGDSDEGEWEDTTQSPESTRRGSVVQTSNSVENAAALVDPLIFVKRPYPQIPRATSLPEPASKSFPRQGHLTDDEDEQHEEELSQQQQEEQDLQGNQQRQETTDQAPPEPSDIASRLLSPSLSAKAPPAMSSISAMAKPATIENPISRNPSFNTLASAQDGSQRRTASSSNPPLANTPGNQTQATSSSIEGGVSRFIVNNNRNNQASFKTDSDPYTPSSFLPHYHPQTPPSPGGPVSSRKTRASPPTRPPGAEPPSRTQQKLWLQRTAALNTSPPDSHVSTTVSPSDPTFAAAHARPGSGPYDAGRSLVNGNARSGGVGQDSEAKQIRKAYEKTALELAVVRRFQVPTADSFNRLRSALQESKAPDERRHSLSKSVKSAPSLTLLRDGQQAGGRGQESNPDPRQPAGRRPPELRPSAPQTYSQDPDDYSVNASDSGELGGQRHPSQRILSTSDDTAHGNPSTDEDGESNDYSNDTEMMIRRMWESRIVATSA